MLVHTGKIYIHIYVLLTPLPSNPLVTSLLSPPPSPSSLPQPISSSFHFLSPIPISPSFPSPFPGSHHHLTPLKKTAHPTNLHQPPPPQHHRTPTLHDAPLGLCRCPSRRIQHRWGLQCCAFDSAADSDGSEFGYLGPVLVL